MTQGPEHLPYEGRLLQMGLLRLGGGKEAEGRQDRGGENDAWCGGRGEGGISLPLSEIAEPEGGHHPMKLIGGRSRTDKRKDFSTQQTMELTATGCSDGHPFGWL